ncbi:hypothetical protein V5O48_012953 [Marasmius crinis-equi]|uniref:F-box domain-containing protein n=1 Tax=Marasmius crinis-equi TaxID=585013 RepID=A0ABR3F1K5_9AGAR
MKAPVSLFNIPTELICDVLMYLEALDILVCSLVDKWFKAIIDESSAIQYKLEMAKHRMVSTLPSHCNPPLASRLRSLRNSEHTWHTLASRARYRSQFIHTGALYEFQSGIFGQSKEDDQNRTTNIVFFDLVKMEAGDPRMHWIHSVAEMMVIDFTMDPSQDLFLLISLAPPSSDHLYDIYFRTLSTNQPHPQAQFPDMGFLERPNAWSLLDGVVVAHISGNLTGLLVKEGPDGESALQGHLICSLDYGSLLTFTIVFYWRSGPHDKCQIKRKSGIDDFNFLSQDKILIVRSAGVFEVYQLPSDYSKSAELLASYAFPAFGLSFNNFWYISLSSHPAPGYNPNNGDVSAFVRDSNQPYACDPEDRLHCCCIYTHTHASAHSFVFYFRSSTFLNPPADWQDIGAGHAFPWNPAIIPNDPDLQALYDSTPPSSAPTSASSSSGFQSSDISSPITSLPFLRPASPPSPVSPTLELEELINLPQPSPAGQSFLFHEASQHSTPTFRPKPYQRSEPIPWNVWGPQSTRWFRQHFSKDWHHATYGLRSAEMVSDPHLVDDPTVVLVHEGELHLISDGDETEPPDEEDVGLPSENLTDLFQRLPSETSFEPSEGQRQGRRGKFLRVKNFNPYVISRMMNETNIMEGENRVVKKDNGLTYRVVTKSSVTKCEGVFKEDVVSSLPYVEVTSSGRFDASDAMLDENRLLLIKRGWRGKLKSVEVLTM